MDWTPKVSSPSKSQPVSRIHAILLAAGTGNRFGDRKQGVLFRGRPLFVWTLEILVSLAHHVVVVGPGSLSPQLEGWNRLRHVEGGGTRVESILAGLSVVCEIEETSGDDIILLADANRPLNQRAVYEMCVAKAKEFGAACPSVDLVDGVALLCSNREFIEKIPDKNRSVSIQTPEAIRVDRLDEVLKMFDQTPPPLGIAEATLQAGFRVATFPNSQRGFKVTYPQDFDVLEAIDATAPTAFNRGSGATR